MTRNLSLTYPRSMFVGFEPLFNELERLTTITPGQDNYPPHNVVKIDDEHFNIEMAVAGFGKDDVEVELKDGTLTISGERSEDEREYAYKGISSRKFSKSFRLAEYVVADGADLVDGVLVVNLRVDIPEEKRPQKIKIGS
jgi:molecular chaperone IbpA